MKNGKVYLIGAGPGDPGLITVKGIQILRQADVVIYDYLVDKRILENTKEGAQLICCDTLGDKRHSDRFAIHQQRISNLIVRKAKEAKNVVRLKNGDPSIFSRLSQELEALNKNKIEYEIVPGVTAATAAACLSGIPLTSRRFSSSVAFVTGHEYLKKSAEGESASGGKKSSIDWENIAKNDTIVLYMAVENLKAVVKKIITAGKSKDTPCAMVQNVSRLDQKILYSKLKDIVKKAKAQRIRPPAIIIIGKVAKLGNLFNWLGKTKHILFTGLSEERFFLKGLYFHLPMIKIEPMKDYREFDDYLRNIKEFDWVIFASRYAAEYFFKRLNIIGLDSRVLSGIKIAAIGDSTKNRLLDFGVIADLVPKKESSEGLIQEFSKLDIDNKKIFLPRSDISDKGLGSALGELGAKTITSFAYRNVMPKNLPDLELTFFDEIMFTSPSTVRNFKKRYKAVPKNIKVKCIGDVTLREAKRCGLAE